MSSDNNNPVGLYTILLSYGDRTYRRDVTAESDDEVVALCGELLPPGDCERPEISICYQGQIVPSERMVAFDWDLLKKEEDI